MPKKAPSAVPAGMNTITTELWFDGRCKEAVETYKKAFGAEVVGEVLMTPDGQRVGHALLKIGNSHVMMNDVMGPGWETAPTKGATAGIWLYVDDCDAVLERAKQVGCEVTMPMADQFWGDRMGKVKDPFGHSWSIATNKQVLTDEEIMQAAQAFFASMG
jgi:PhnB protein